MDRPKVVKLAQPGIDVKTAGDENLVYNSNWPLLKIYKQGSFTQNSFPASTGSPQKIKVINHDLGYTPMFWWFANMDIKEWNTTTGAFDTRTEFNGPVENFPATNSSELYYWFILQDVPVKIYYYIFALDITTAYQAPIIKSGGVIGPRNNRTVFKLAKENADVYSSNLEDYVVNSLARSPMIHAVYPATVQTDASIPGGSGITFYHNLGYVPLFFAYVKLGTSPDINTGFDGYELLRPDGSGASGFTVDEQKIQYFNLNIGRHISLVVLKDPFDVAYSVDVSI